MRRRRLNCRLTRIVWFHGHKSPKHLERAGIPVFDYFVMSGEALIHECTQVGTNGFSSVPVAYTQVRYGILLESVKTLALGLVIDLLPKRQQLRRGCGLGKCSRLVHRHRLTFRRVGGGLRAREVASRPRPPRWRPRGHRGD